MRKRAAAIIIINDQFLMMKRIKQSKEYYVFIGGGVEEGESVENAVVREVKEETSCDIQVGELVLELHRTDWKEDQLEYYFITSWIQGTPVLGGEEKEKQTLDDQFFPVWISIDQFKQFTVHPKEAKDKVLEYLEDKKIL